MRPAIVLLLVAATVPSSGCETKSYDNVQSCRAFVESAKCGEVDPSDQIDCGSYAKTPCDISPYLDCLADKYVCKDGQYDLASLARVGECAHFLSCSDTDPSGHAPDGGATSDAAGGSASCDRYLSCLLVLTPEAYAGALNLYGNGAACWRTAEQAQNCSQACDVAFEKIESDCDCVGTNCTKHESPPVLVPGVYSLSSVEFTADGCSLAGENSAYANPQVSRDSAAMTNEIAYFAWPGDFEVPSWGTFTGVTEASGLVTNGHGQLEAQDSDYFSQGYVYAQVDHQIVVLDDKTFSSQFTFKAWKQDFSWDCESTGKLTLRYDR